MNGSRHQIHELAWMKKQIQQICLDQMHTSLIKGTKALFLTDIKTERRARNVKFRKMYNFIPSGTVQAIVNNIVAHR